ncbi:MAG: hypothetical protein HIU83_04060 [Proteobacteria bacterium]|nr:hypothetical protein [Pseudomonadota bacterium]
MRITANITSDNSLYNIQQGRAKLDKINELISTGSNVNRPSDDPINTRLLLDIGDKVSAGDQYLSNIQKASTLQQITNTALTGMSDTMQLAKTLVASITNGSSDATVRQNAVSQLQALKQQMVDMGNMQNGEQYIFGGASNTTPPFISKSGDLTSGDSKVLNANVTGLKPGMQVSGTGIPAGTVIGTINNTVPTSFTLVDSSTPPVSVTATATIAGSSLNIYAGDSTQSSVEIAQGSKQALNVTGDRLLKGTGANPSYGATDIFKAFDDLITAVTANDVPGIQAGAQALGAGANQINTAQSDVSARVARLDSMTKLNQNTRNTLMTVYSNTQNVDLAKMAVGLTQQQTAFQASLQATAKVSQLSLLDYLT